jgi:hypothetical protein
MAARPLRIVIYGVLMLVAVVWLAARAAPPIAVDQNARDITIAAMEATLADLRRATAEQGPLVIVLGDSSLGWHPPLGPGEDLSTLLEAEGARVGLPLHVVQRDGFDAVAYYLLVDAIAALRPKAVVLTANLQSFTEQWFKRTNMKHPQLAAFVRPTRLWGAMRLPLELAGITDASLVVKPVFRVLGASDVPERIDGYRTRIREGIDAWLAGGGRARLAGGVAYAHMEAPAPVVPPPGAAAPAPRQAPVPGAAPAKPGTVPALPSAPAVAPPPPAKPGVMVPAPGTIPRPGRRGRNAPAPGRPFLARGAYRFMDLYPSNLDPGQSTVRVHGATVRDLTRRGVRTIVFLAPLHVQAAKLTGAWTQQKMPEAVQIVRTATIDNGGEFVDLAEALPQESYFVDRYTHFTADGNRRVRDELLDEIVRLVGGGTPKAP